MPALHVRNVPPELYEALRSRAKSQGRSISAETIAILRRELHRQEEAEQWIRELDEMKRTLPLWPADGPTPEEIIRRDRESH